MTPVDTVIRCPHCGREEPELIPDDACVIEYECEGCHAVLRPKDGDCCVFCSYAQDRCPWRRDSKGSNKESRSW